MTPAFDDREVLSAGHVVDSFEGLQRLSPAFGLFDVNASQSFLAVRGGVSLDESASADPSVAVWVDDFYLGRGPASRLPFFDVQSIDLHFGPQGDRFGRSAIGGAVSVYSRDPSAGSYLQVEGHLPSGLGMEVRKSATTARGVAVGLAARRSKFGSFSDNTAGQSIESRLDNAVSIKLEASSDRAYHWGSLTWQEREADAPARFLVFNTRPVSLAPSIEPGLEDQTYMVDRPFTRNTVDRFVYKAGSIDSDDAGWQAVLGTQNALARVLNNDFSPGGLQPRILARETVDRERSASAELRGWWATSGWDLLASAYVRYADAFRSEDFLLDPAPGSRAAAIFGDDAKRNVVSQSVDNVEVSLVFSAFREWSDSWSTRLAVRGTRDEKRGSTTITGDRDTFLLRSAPFAVRWDDHWSYASPSVAANWSGGDSGLGLEWRRGFKPGGFTNSVNNPVSAVTPFDPEHADIVEMRWDYKPKSKPLWFSALLHETQYDDLQTLIVRSDPQAGLIQEVTNAGRAKTRGLELEAGLVTEDATYSASATWQDARYTDFRTASSTGGALDFTGQRVPLTPARAFRVAADHALGKVGQWSWRVGATLAYHSELSFFPDANQSALVRSETDLTDITVWLEGGHGAWAWRLQGNNLLDERPFVFANNASSSFYFSGAQLVQGAQVIYGSRLPGRTVELSVRRNFE